MEELIREHVRARKLVSALEAAGRSYRETGDEKLLGEIKETLEQITALYPRHIEKEDKKFFKAAMEYLNGEEQDEMLEKFAEFDRRMIHDKYKNVVEEQEEIFGTA